VGSLEPKFFSGLCQRLGRMDLLEAGYDLSGGAERVKAELSRLFSEHPLAHWQQLLAGSDLCIEPVLEGDEVLADPQHRARGLFVEVEDAQRGRKVTHLLTPLRMGQTPLRPPPALGQHSREILAEAGFSPDEMQRLGF
jgi:crotonobetainyl-CoA:carnitine CoA-transferase CaiB-like acyl-CoA transferase